MKKKTWTLLAAVVLTCGIAQGDIQSDMQAELPLQDVLRNATDSGMTIDVAVNQAIAAAPYLAGDIVTAAVALLPDLPYGACTSQSEDRATWLAECETTVIQAAIALGIDPSIVTAAAASGRAAARAVQRGLEFIPAAGGGGLPSPS